MKKLIIMIGLMAAFANSAQAGQRMPITGLVPVDNMYASFEIQTPKFDRIILDCQSFINGMNFYNNDKVVHVIKMVDYGTCDGVYNFIEQSNLEKKPVCMEIEEGTNSLNLSNDLASDCQ